MKDDEQKLKLNFQKCDKFEIGLDVIDDPDYVWVDPLDQWIDYIAEEYNKMKMGEELKEIMEEKEKLGA